MSSSSQPRVTSTLRIGVVYLAVVCLAASLAVPAPPLELGHHGTVVKSHSPRAKRQKLHQDAEKFVAPVAILPFLSSPTEAYEVPASAPLLALDWDDSLYNRPPPSC